MVFELIKNKIKKVSDNSKKAKTEKFLVLLDFIESIQEMELSLINIETKYSQIYLHLKIDVDKSNMEVQLKSDLNLFNCELERLLKHFSARLYKYRDSKFGVDTYKTQNYLSKLYSGTHILNIIKLIQIEKSFFVELNFLKEAFKNSELQLLTLEKKNLSYFEDVKIEKKMMSDFLVNKKV